MDRDAEPDIRPLGGLALAAGVLSVLLAVSYFFSPLAYLAAVPAVALGVVARSDERVRAMGNAALVFAVVAVVWATVVIVLTF